MNFACKSNETINCDMGDKLDMVSLELAFAVGAIAVAAGVGGILYAVYPSDFGAYNEPATSSTSSATYGGTPTESTGATSNTTGQDQTGSNPAPSGPGY